MWKHSLVLLTPQPFAPGAVLAVDFTKGQYRNGLGVRATQRNPAALAGWNFTRTGTGLADNSAGTFTTFASNAPRITDKGLLVEEARTNLVLQSQAFDNASWAQANASVVANVATAPDGTTTADRVVATAGSLGFRELQQATSVTAGTTYVYSVFLKEEALRYAQLVGNSTQFGTFAMTVDLRTGSETFYTAGNSTVVARGVVPAGLGYYRVWIAVTCLASGSGRITFNLMPDGTSVRGQPWNSDGTSGLVAWGAQMEAGTFPTSYVATTSATATRAADAAFLLNFVPPSGPFTIYVETSLPVTADGVVRRALSVTDGTVSNRMSFARDGTNNAALAMTSGGGASAFPTAFSGYAGTPTIRQAVSFDGATNYVYAAGGQVAPNLSTTPPVGLNRLEFGAQVGGNPLNGWIRKVIVFPWAMSAAELRALTQ